MLFMGMLLSPALWFGFRYFPSYRLINVPHDTNILETTLSVCSILFCLSLIFLKQKTLFTVLLLTVNIALALLDANRLQIWFSVCNIMLFVLLFYSGRVDEPNKFTSFFVIQQYILASLYFFYGYGIISGTANPEDFKSFISPLNNYLSQRQFSFFERASLIIPYFFISVSIALLIRPLRFLAVFISILLHLLIIIFALPGKDGIPSIWFINFPLIALLLFLFSGTTKQRYFSPAILFQKPLFYLTIIVFWALPFFHNKNLPKFSSIKYGLSSQKTYYSILISKNCYQQLPLDVKHFCVPYSENFVVQLNAWGRAELQINIFYDENFLALTRFKLAAMAGVNVKEIQLKSDSSN
jgi:hypothetical protein